MNRIIAGMIEDAEVDAIIEERNPDVLAQSL